LKVTLAYSLYTVSPASTKAWGNQPLTPAPTPYLYDNVILPRLPKAKLTHPAIKHKPPIGVTGPRTLHSGFKINP
jgi:hypothetical protein